MKKFIVIFAVCAMSSCQAVAGIFSNPDVVETTSTLIGTAVTAVTGGNAGIGMGVAALVANGINWMVGRAKVV